MEESRPARTRKSVLRALILAVAVGYTTFLGAVGGWQAVAVLWVPFLLMFGPVIVAVRFGWRSLGKRADGSRSWAARLLFLPYLLITRGAFELVTMFSREKPFAVVAPNLAFGRRLSNSEARRTGFVSVLDLTSEFTGLPAFRSLAGYRSLPVFDYTAPTPEQLRFAAEWIGEAVKRGTVYVHCALGHGRSACVVLAYLLSTGRVATLAEGLKLLRERRPKVKLHRSQRQALRHYQPLESVPMTALSQPADPQDDGLVSHTEEKSPAEVAAYWTPERIAALQPVPMPRPSPSPDEPADSKSAG